MEIFASKANLERARHLSFHCLIQFPLPLEIFPIILQLKISPRARSLKILRRLIGYVSARFRAGLDIERQRAASAIAFDDHFLSIVDLTFE